MKNKWISLLVIILAVAVVSAGCAPGNNKGANGAEGTPTENGQVTEVTIALPVNNKASFNQFIERFNDANDTIKIKPLWGADQVQLIAANKAPDIIETGDLHIENHKDILLPLDELISRDAAELNPDDFYPQLMEPLQLDGKQLALPRSFNVGLLYYNKTLFDEAGVDYPTEDWTIQNFIEAGQKLTKRDNAKTTQWGSSTVFGWWGEWLIHVRQSGGDFMNADGQVTLNTPEAIRGLQLFLDKTSLGAHKFAPGPTDDALGGFGGQLTAMEYGGHTGLWVGYNQIVGLEWDIEVLPSGLARRDGGELALEGWGVNSQSAHADAAWEVLKFLTSVEGQKLQLDLGRTPARRAVADIALATPKEERSHPQNLEALFKALEGGMVLPRDPNFINAAIQVVQPNIDLLLEGKLTPEAAGNESTAKAQEYFDQLSK